MTFDEWWNKDGWKYVSSKDGALEVWKAAQEVEREACINVCNELRSLYRHQASGYYDATYDFKQMAAEEIIDEISARGEK